MYDTIILGAGPAGLTAGLYASRAKLKTLIIEKLMDGGQIATTDSVENYPGAPKNTSGVSLSLRMAEQAEMFGAENVRETVKEVNLSADPKVVITDKNVYETKTVIIATGTKSRKIGALNEDKFIGKGISFCATCDGAFTEGADVYVVGGGDSAVEEAMFLTRFAEKVTIIHRRDSLKAAKSIQEKAFKNEKLDFMWNSQVVEVNGDKFLDSIVVENTKTGEKTVINADSKRIFLFEYIGSNPNSELFSSDIKSDRGYIETDELMRTKIDGVFAAGDIREKSLRQVVTAASDGAIAANSAEKYIDNHKK